MASVSARIDRAVERSARKKPVTLVAVSKTHPAAAIREAYEAGQRQFGESRVHEFEQKRPLLAAPPLPGAVWRMIGHLQSNKARRAAQLFDVVETLDSRRLAVRLDAAAAEYGRRLGVFIEVKLGSEANAGGAFSPPAATEAAKTGCSEAELPGLAMQVSALPNIELLGLMTVPPFTADPEGARPYFRRLREWGERFGTPELSMGMSRDFEVAIEEGATVVRVGAAIFGERMP